MKNTSLMALLCSLWLGIVSTSALASQDMPGALDFENLPRVDGTYIGGYSFSEYNVGLFVNAVDDRKKPQTVEVEGKRTRILYVGKTNQSSLQMVRNYQKAFENFGEYTEILECSQQCSMHAVAKVAWNGENFVPTESIQAGYVLYPFSTVKQVRYVYGTVVREGKQYHVSVLAAYKTGGEQQLINVPVVILEVIEVEDFESDLVFVKAEEMISQIQATGSIALYGIQFGFDSSVITASSVDTIQEIAKALKATPELAIYVVGHTDNEGEMAYNQKLSTERARAVVAMLKDTHSIAAERVVAAGVGPVVPVASNDTKEGRTLNRRVEIVKR